MLICILKLTSGVFLSHLRVSADDDDDVVYINNAHSPTQWSSNGQIFIRQVSDISVLMCRYARRGKHAARQTRGVALVNYT